MKINLEKLKEILKSTKAERSRYPSGLFWAINAIYNCTDSDEVDWNSFTLTEAEMALDHAMGYESYEILDEFGEDGYPNKGNAIHEYLLNNEGMYELKQKKPQNQINGDFF